MHASNHASFSTNVWLFSAFFTPFIASLFIGLFESHLFASIFFAIIYVFPVSLLMSLPCYLLLILVSSRINHSKLRYSKKKTYINLIAIVITFCWFLLLFLILGFPVIEEILLLTFGYGVTLSFAIWYFKLTLIETNLSIQNQKPLDNILDDENY